ncbi:MAG: hypothetical protein NZ772_09040 [Cyanobacteria bacterium]|nr:hypothetical protein [Cyanobacteriota bacterium]MDW8199914.1 hypothetical protein [Cyanobacteriota bacterium SKYGB_h_bin112]
MATTDVWYIVKQESGHCEIRAGSTMHQPQPSTTTEPQSQDVWGPFSSRQEAIARRVGLIRAGKCLPS